MGSPGIGPPAESVQPRRFVLAAGVWGLGLLLVCTRPVVSPDSDWQDGLIRNTVRLSLLFYAAAVTLMVRLPPGPWAVAEPDVRLARLCWTLAWVAFLFHLRASFYYFHHDSHADAVRHVREVSGVGEGIYVSHLFSLLWTIDVVWWWLAPGLYGRRPAAGGRLLHAFMAFIIFNGAVVYETGFSRVAGLAMFGWIAGWLARRSVSRGVPPATAAHPGEPPG